MSHIQQVEFCLSIKKLLPAYFENCFVLDIGSLDINGNNQSLFDNCHYIGVDVAVGKNVDIICKGHELALPDGTFDTIISTECFEHDQFYHLTLKNIVRLLKPGGLFLFSCATTGRPEHGTRRTTPQDAPLLQAIEDWSDYYKNLTETDIRTVLDIDALFSEYGFSECVENHDLYFWGIKTGQLSSRTDYSFQIVNSELQNRLARLKKIDEMEKENIRLENERQKITAWAQVLDKKSQEDDVNILNFKKTIKDLSDEKESLRIKVLEREEQVNNFQKVIDNLSNEKESLHISVLEKEAQINSGQKTIENLSSEKESLNIKILDLFQELTHLQKNHQDVADWAVALDSIVLQRDEQIRQIYASQSWRYTKPLRKVGDIYKRLSRMMEIMGLALRHYKSIPVMIMKAFIALRQDGIEGVRLRANMLLLSQNRHDLLLPQSINHDFVVEKPCQHQLKVSIIVPNYNHAKYLKKRLDSIYSQTYTNYEVILLDDCSTDDSRLILNDYAQQYSNITKCVFNNKNMGSPFYQWQKGLEQANGDLIWIAESDDYCTPNFLEDMVHYFDNELIMLAFARTVFVNGDDEKPTWTTEEYLSDLGKYDWTDSFVKSAHWLVNNFWAIKNIIPNVSSAVFRRPSEIKLLQNDDWKKMKVCGDWIFYLHLIRGGAVAYSTKSTNFYRQHPNNTSVSSQSKDIYYKEHELVAKELVSLYRIDEEHIIRQRNLLTQQWLLCRNGESIEKLHGLYDIKQIQEFAKFRKPNLMMVGFALIAGGGETFPIMLSNLFKNHGYSVTFFNCKREDTQIGVRKMLRTDIPLLEIEHLEQAAMYCQDLGVEVVHSHHAWVDMTMAALLSQYSNIRHVITMHGMYETLSSAQLANVMPVLEKQIDKIVYIAEKNKQPFSKDFIESKNFVRIDNALPIIKLNPISRSSLDIPEDAFVLCLVSRGIPEKGWEEAILVVEEAQSLSQKEIYLLIVGDGIEYERLLPKNKNPRIKMLGFKKNTRDYFAMADLGFLPSRFKGESFPLVLIDCLQAGKPVLASNIGEIANMITYQNVSAGVLFDLKDWTVPVSDVAKLVAQLAEGNTQYLDLYHNVKTVVEKFDPNVLVDKYEQIYIEACEQ